MQSPARSRQIWELNQFLGLLGTSFPTPSELTRRSKKSMLSHIEEPAPQCQGHNPLSQGTFRGMLKHDVLICFMFWP